VRRTRPSFELVDVAGRLAREDLDRVLVAEVVGAFDGVESMDLGRVFGRVAERRIDAALGRARMAAGRVQLRDHGDVAPASYASMAARIPAQPAPTTRTSCVAST